MAISTANSGSSAVKADINVTPMIDVMLVLLIIFMIVTPLIAAGFKATLPKGKNLDPRPEGDNEVVLGIDEFGRYFLNGRPLPEGTLGDQLKGIFAARTEDKILLQSGQQAEVLEDQEARPASGGVRVRHHGAEEPGLFRRTSTRRRRSNGVTAGASSGGVQSDINVTPMIDVLLVLLIIFMIPQPLSRMAMDVQVPPDETKTNTPPPNQIVLELADDGSYSINGQPVRRTSSTPRSAIYDQRPAKLLFIKAGPNRIYQDVVEAMDVARGAGVQIIGFTPQEANASK